MNIHPCLTGDMRRIKMEYLLHILHLVNNRIVKIIF